MMGAVTWGVFWGSTGPVGSVMGRVMGCAPHAVPAGLQQDEVEQFLAEVMDNEFDTAVEDGSLQEVSRQLLWLWGASCRGDVPAVGRALSSLSLRAPGIRAAVAATQRGGDEKNKKKKKQNRGKRRGFFFFFLGGSKKTVSRLDFFGSFKKYCRNFVVPK
uniref:Pre-rRNA-processing protein TSR2 homolog n=1 Tax=Coturnix japonica TaxID=93934 RepID=A0A8C2SRS1_COTJA